MSALANILLSTLTTGTFRTSDAAVGFNKTFAPEGWKPGGMAAWVDRSGGIPLGYPRITFGLRSPTKESRVYRIGSKMFLPTLETIDPAVGIFGPKLAYDIQFHLDALIPERATSTDRSVALALLRSYLGTLINASDDVPTDSVGSPFVAAIMNLEDVF